MSYVYGFCAAVGAMAYGVGVAVGAWAQKRRMLEEIEGTELTIEQFRHLKRENERLSKANTNCTYQRLCAEQQAEELREQLFATHHELMKAYDELHDREHKEAAE